jgi:hypothetical protein
MTWWLSIRWQVLTLERLKLWYRLSTVTWINSKWSNSLSTRNLCHSTTLVERGLQSTPKAQVATLPTSTLSAALILLPAGWWKITPQFPILPTAVLALTTCLLQVLLAPGCLMLVKYPFRITNMECLLTRRTTLYSTHVRTWQLKLILRVTCLRLDWDNSRWELLPWGTWGTTQSIWTHKVPSST